MQGSEFGACVSSGILSSLNLPETERHFEQALIICPLEHKLRLYGRYISWVEETYPSLGAASELRSILYRCVKETSALEGVHNHPIYVDVWLKLVNYCDAPTELFNLLFHKGIGTLRANFYISWTDHIQHLPERTSTQPLKRWAHLATILARGLRAGAQPILLLEDRAESLVQSVHYVERLREEKRYFEGLSEDRRRAPRPVGGGSGERKVLASLQTIEATDPVAGQPSIITPSVRIAHALHPEQRGLRSLEGKSQSPRQSNRPSSGLQIYRDENGRTGLPNPNSNANPIANLPSIESVAGGLGKCLSRLAEPVASWNAENVETPIARLDWSTALSSTSVPMLSSQPRKLAIYRDPSEETNSMAPRNAFRGCTLTAHWGSSSRARLPSTSTRPRGLRVATREEKHGQHHVTLLYSFECLKSALLSEKMSGAKEAAEALDDSEFDMEFFCDVDALYSHNEETCFEMNRVLKEVLPSYAIEDAFSLNLDDPHSKSLINQIERIIKGDYPEDEEVAHAQPAKRNDCSNLIGMLEAIIAKAENSDYSREEQII
ncbi:Mitotic checkpoint serine/threonine-protein kinase BUB1 beta [Taenia crassiceps]|uniref:Mitotic checkpoint serine/threonine-protein kinase BUB1 beta n=1 Tax=Taenia crassiceps TaxID=6207 RepID=A0ABR4Q4W5_9CEST